MMSSAGNRRKTASAGSMVFWYGSAFGAGKAVFPLFKKDYRRDPAILWARVFQDG
jgi:hypothetical protein